MANRKQRRKNKEKYNFNYDENSSNITKVVITLLVVIAIIVIFYLVTVLINNNKRKLNTTEKKNEEVKIQYQEILANDTFVMSPKEYYVLFYDFDASNSAYYDYLYTKYKNDKDNVPIYKVDLGNGFNEKFVNTKTNPKAQNASQLKLKDATLILIKNGKNVSYTEGGIQNISNVLS